MSNVERISVSIRKVSNGFVISGAPKNPGDATEERISTSYTNTKLYVMELVEERIADIFTAFQSDDE